MKNLSIVGYYGYNNCGDEALKEAVENMLGNHAHITFTTPDDTTKLENPIMGGGDIINPFFLKRVAGEKDVKILGAGMGYPSEVDLLVEAGNVSEVFFRNKADVELAKSKGLNAHYTPDIAFTLEPPETCARPPLPECGKKKRVGILVADNISQSFKQTDPQQIGYGLYLKTELAKTILALREYYQFVFIPMSHARYGYDVKMFYEILSFLPPLYFDHVIMPPSLLPGQVMNIIQELDLVLTMRFHGLIFSTLAGVPFINIGVSRKNKTFMLDNNLMHLSIDPFTLTSERLLGRIASAEQSNARAWVKECREINKEKIKEVVQHVREKWC